MRKKIMVTGLMMAAMLTISACGSKNTTKTTTAAPTTTAVETTMEETTSTEAEESAITDESDESEAPGELTAEQMKAFGEEIQAAVAGRDIGWLADLTSFPVYVSLEEGDGSEIQSKEEFMELGADKLFTEKLIEQIAGVNLDELEMFGAGVIMGGDASITFNNVDGEPAVTSINL